MEKPVYITIESDSIRDFNTQCNKLHENGYKPLYRVIRTDHKYWLVQQWKLIEIPKKA